MNLNISFSPFQETGQTDTKYHLKLVQSPDDTAFNKQDNQVTLFTLQFDHTVFDALPDNFWAWISLLLKIHENGW